MPLAFQSLSHGQIAFGFFNIESDMLLLEHYFLFADTFCEYLSELADNCTDTIFLKEWAVYDIRVPGDIGDLMGAIHGISFTGFIGEVYRRFPFPVAIADFKQNPEGNRTQSTVSRIINSYAKKVSIAFHMDAPQEHVRIGEYLFDRLNFQALLKYVWQGGYPHWKNESPPEYVLEMRRRVLGSRNPLFQGMGGEPSPSRS